MWIDVVWVAVIGDVTLTVEVEKNNTAVAQLVARNGTQRNMMSRA
jgi:hypothetical protein